MPRKGRKPKPPQLKVVEGNPGKRRIPEDYPKPQPVAPAEPSWPQLFRGRAAARLRKDARAEWARVVPTLDGLGLLSVIDGATLTDYCVCWARVVQCERAIAEEGLVISGDRGKVKHPALTAANQYRTQLRFYIAELGFSPSSRGRLNMPRDPADDDVDLFGT